MTDQERLEYIKTLHEEANEIGKNGEHDSEEKILEILRRLFYQAHTDWLIKQAERAQKNAQDLEDMDRQLYSEQKRVHELELQNSGLYGRICKINKENNQLWYENKLCKQALEDIKYKFVSLSPYGAEAQRDAMLEIVNNTRQELVGESNG